MGISRYADEIAQKTTEDLERNALVLHEHEMDELRRPTSIMMIVNGRCISIDKRLTTFEAYMLLEEYGIDPDEQYSPNRWAFAREELDGIKPVGNDEALKFHAGNMLNPIED